VTQRKYPERRIWKNFELVNKRNRKLHLLDHVNDLVSRARERFTELGWSKLEELSWEQGDNRKKLFRDICRVRENLSAAKTIDWAQHKGILSKLSDEGHFAHASDNDIALACYTRVLELIVEEPKWEKLREQSQALVFWLLKIGHPGSEGRDGLRVFNRMASKALTVIRAVVINSSSPVALELEPMNSQNFLGYYFRSVRPIGI
jgi:hypothetical protein